MALVLYLQALTINVPGRTCSWSPVRQSFIARFRKNTMEARTDGYMTWSSKSRCSDTLVFLEAKARIRDRGPRGQSIYMQEAAEMINKVILIILIIFVLFILAVIALLILVVVVVVIIITANWLPVIIIVGDDGILADSVTITIVVDIPDAGGAERLTPCVCLPTGVTLPASG